MDSGGPAPGGEQCPPSALLTMDQVACRLGTSLRHVRRLVGYWHNGRRHVAAMSFKTKGDARAFLSAVETDIRRGVWIDPWAGRLRVSELAREWTASNPTKRESTTAREELALRLHVLPTIGSLHIEPVSYTHLTLPTILLV